MYKRKMIRNIGHVKKKDMEIPAMKSGYRICIRIFKLNFSLLLSKVVFITAIIAYTFIYQGYLKFNVRLCGLKITILSLEYHKNRQEP